MKTLLEELSENLSEFGAIARSAILRYYYLRESSEGENLSYWHLTREELEDLESETILRVVKRVRKRRRTKRVSSAWLRREVRSCAWRAWRLRSVQHVTLEEKEIEAKSSAKSSGVLETIEAKSEEERTLVGAILLMNSANVSELSRAMGVSTRTVFRTLKRLRNSNECN